MFKGIKKLFQEQREKRIKIREKKAERLRQEKIEEERKKREKLERIQIIKAKEKQRKKEKLQFIQQEIDAYLETVYPALLAVPEISEGLLTILKARQSGGRIKVQMTEEYYEKLLDFYNEYLNIFIQNLEERNLGIDGLENEFLEMLLKKVDEVIYENFHLKYGNFTVKESDLDIIIHKYFMLFDEDDRYQADTIKYFSICLERNKFYSGAYSVNFLVEKIEEYDKLLQ